MGITSPEAVREATTQFLPTGRPNPKYNQRVAGLVSDATKRMIGEDPGYDDFTRRIYGTAGTRPAATEAVPAPVTSTGQLDRMRLKDGQTYAMPDGTRARWNARRNGFEVVQ